MKNIVILGTVGVPANYGGFETLAENLVKYHAAASLADGLTVYCSGKSYPERSPAYLSARLRYVLLNANGAQASLMTSGRCFRRCGIAVRDLAARGFRCARVTVVLP